MAGNTDPIFTKNGKVNGAMLTAANTSSQGGGTIGTDIFLVATADATNGGFVRFVRFYPTATVATTTTACVGRVFKSSVSSGATTSANTHNLGAMTLPSTTVGNTTTAEIWFDVPVNQPVDPGATILAVVSVAPAANTGWKAVAFFGDY